MHDVDGPLITEWFYKALLERDVITLDDIPYALDEAVTRLRESNVSVARWATFMHIGG